MDVEAIAIGTMEYDEIGGGMMRVKNDEYRIE